MSSKDFKSNAYYLLILGLVVGTFAVQVNAQTNSSNRLTGSYQLDASRSANVTSIVETASRQNGFSAANKIDLQTKLDPPATVTLEISGTQVALTSSNGNPINLNADGNVVTAYGSNGTRVDIRSNLIGDTLKVSSKYDKTDYSITFRSMNNGKNLQVTRTVKTDYLQQPVLATSLYKRTGSPPVFAGNSNTDPRFSNNEFIVPSGTVLNVALENYISTKDSQDNDRFRLIVQSPAEYQGAIVEGYLSGIERANGITGTAKVNLNFQTIRLTNGQTYNFTGIIQSIDVSDKSPIKSNDESQIKGQNRTNESIKRGILGAGIGAVIGAAIIGKKGALIGGAIGGAAGTGTVLLEKPELQLKEGTQLGIESTSPS